MKQVTVIGAGLAGCEACWQLISRNIPVKLVEMRPTKMTPAHHTGGFSELVCSNSLRSDSLLNGIGVLKEEMRYLNSLIMEVADNTKLPAGSALAVDREKFSSEITRILKEHPLVTFVNEEVTEIPEGPVIIATGPLTSDTLSEDIKKQMGDDQFYFYDAAAPIIEKDSIDFDKVYFKSRYDKGEDDYINCPMNKMDFIHFYHELVTAKTTQTKEFEKEIFFEGCMPIEVMAKRGDKTLLYGPMKPVGLENGRNKPYAVVQLRQDNAVGSLYNIVGFQTHLTWPEQKRIIQMIPGLENANIVRYGVMHRNSYINSPRHLKETYQWKKREDVFFAGQMTGVEGYIESAASGLVAGINMAKYINDQPCVVLPNTCLLGSLSYYITHANPNNFQPMNANFGIVRLLGEFKKDEKKAAYAPQALRILKEYL